MLKGENFFLHLFAYHFLPVRLFLYFHKCKSRIW